MIADRRTNAELTDFLRSRRATLRRVDLGLPSANRPRATLSQEDVAELAGVSRQWYLAFETGQLERPTVGMLERVAIALRLDPADVETLVRLAVRGALALPPPLASPNGAVLEAVGPIRDFARRSAATSSVEELATLGSRAVALAMRAAFAYAAIVDDAGEVATCVDATARGSRMIGLRDRADHTFSRELAAGRTVACESTRRCGVAVIEQLAELTGARSVLSTSLVRAGHVVGVVGVSFDHERTFHASEIAIVETVRAIAELALAGT